MAGGRPPEMQAANVKLLEELCQPGDFLPADLRLAAVRETWQATASCEACRKIQEQRGTVEKTQLWEVVAAQHEGQGDLELVVHALCNLQNLMSETWYHQAAEHVFQVCLERSQIPDTQADRLVRLTELIAVVALAVGLRAFYRAMPEDGPWQRPPLPAVREGKPRFTQASEVCQHLGPREDVGWGVGLVQKDVNPELMVNGAKFFQEFSSTKFGAVVPLNKWAPAFSTGSSFLRWGSEVYTPLQHGHESYHFMFKRAPGRALNRVALEDVAGGYTTAVGCSF